MTKTGLSLNLVGADDLKKALAALPRKYSVGVQRKVNREAGKIPEREMKAKAPNARLSKSIKKRAGKGKAGSIMIGSTDFVARFFERGTAIRSTKKGANRGRHNPEPFIEKSIDVTVPETIDFVNKEYGTIAKGYLEKVSSNLRTKVRVSK